jgi:hypothetical protein
MGGVGKVILATLKEGGWKHEAEASEVQMSGAMLK